MAIGVACDGGCGFGHGEGCGYCVGGGLWQVRNQIWDDRRMQQRCGVDDWEKGEGEGGGRRGGEGGEERREGGERERGGGRGET